MTENMYLCLTATVLQYTEKVQSNNSIASNHLYFQANTMTYIFCKNNMPFLYDVTIHHTSTFLKKGLYKLKIISLQYTILAVL